MRQAGEVASQIAAEAFEQRTDDGNPEQQLSRIATAGQPPHLRAWARATPSLRGMGTTLTGALVVDDEVTIVHVGDSRAYLLRDGELRQLTRDHSLVEELRRQGRLTSEEAEEHPQRSVVTRALGVEPDVELDVHTHQARSGDLFLLCSDGLTSMVRAGPHARDHRRERLAAHGGRPARGGGERDGRPRQHHRGPVPPRR